MKKTLERLRRLKEAATERMSQINSLATKEARDLSATEKAEYQASKLEAEELATSIAELEQQHTEPGSTAANPVNAAERAEGQRLERERCAAIDVAAAVFLRRGEIDQKFVDTFKAAEKSLAEFKAAVADELAKRSEENPIIGSHSTSVVTKDARLKQREGMIEALLHRHDPKVYKVASTNEFRGMSMMRMAEECLASSGVRVRGMSPMELATAALSTQRPVVAIGDFGLEQLAGMGTSDFPFITANVANKTLRMAYDAESQTFREFCRQTTNRDFKSKYVNQLGDAPDLEKIGDGGEVKYGEIPEARENYKLETYAKILPFTRQALINDDMGAFTRLPELQGRAVARKESDIVWGLIINNPTMGDGIALFHASHGNLPTAAALSASSWATAKAAMRKQKGLEGTQRLNLEAKFLLACSDLEQTALQLTSVNYVAAKQGDINPWAGRITPVIESRLDDLANTGKAWLAVADPSRIDTIEFAYLEGQQGAYLETEIGFEIEGMKLKVRLDFGAAVIDWRSIVKNAGA